MRAKHLRLSRIRLRTEPTALAAGPDTTVNQHEWPEASAYGSQEHASSGRPRDGYVLLVVIAVSVLVITALGTLAKQSLRRGLEAADAERSLQKRWGAFTLERVLLVDAPKVFALLEETAAKLTPGVPPPTTIRAALTLNGVTFDLLLADEDAKLNLNTLYHHVGEQRTQQAISEIVGPGAGSTMRLVPAVKPMMMSRESRRTTQESEEDGAELMIPDAFRSWGEIFDLGSMEAQIGSDAALPNLTTDITCWGTGQLNIRRASDQAILAVASSVVQDGGAQRLLTRYRESPKATLGVLLQTEISSQRNRDQLSTMLSEASTNFSVWIDASAKGSGSQRWFAVMRRDEEGVTRQTRFAH